MRDAVRQHVFEHMRPMVAAQIAAAIGISHFMLRDEQTGEFRRVMDPDQIERALNSPGAAEGSTYWIFSKDPSTPAFTDLMNRAIDKPKEQPQEVTLGVSETTLAILDRWKLQNRQREELEAARALTGKPDDS